MKREIEETLDYSELIIISGALSLINEMEDNKRFKELENKVTRIAFKKAKDSFKEEIK